MAVTEVEQRWLAAAPVVERVQLDATSWVDVARALVRDADAVHDELLATATWEQGRVFRYEKYVPEPRMMGAQPPDARHPALVALTTWLTRRYRVPFPGPALVQYRDERDSVGFHRDRELRWLDDTVIGVATFGAHRPWLMRPIGGNRYALDDDLADAIDLSPASGDLLVMGGRSQANWLHAVPKTRGRVRSRISAQWRWTSKRGRRDTNPNFSAPRHFSR
jgi:alkylated DNA repair dioxygenase AlkB